MKGNSEFIHWFAFKGIRQFSLKMTYTMFWCKTLKCLLIMMKRIIPHINTMLYKLQDTLTSLTYLILSNTLQRKRNAFYYLCFIWNKLRDREVKPMPRLSGWGNWHLALHSKLKNNVFPTTIMLLKSLTSMKGKHQMMMCHCFHTINIHGHTK